LGRRGRATPGAEEAIGVLRAAGATVSVVAGDVSDAAAIEGVVAGIRAGPVPLQGILHAAMVLDDAPIAKLDESRMNAVLAPKLDGAWQLHRLTRDLPLEYFVVYSSIATILGNPGQAHYAAANAGLESLCSLRGSMGLPAHCVRWGPIADAGFLARNPELRERLETHLGAAAVPAREALDMLDAILASPLVHSTVCDVNWAMLARHLPAASQPRFADLVDKQMGGTAEKASELRDSIRKLPREEANARVLAMVTEELAQVLLMDASRIDPAHGLQDLGLDSLMGVELALGVERRLGLRLHGMAVAERPTVHALATHIVEHLLGDADSRPAESTARDLALLAARHRLEVTSEEVVQVANRLHDTVRSS